MFAPRSKSNTLANEAILSEIRSDGNSLPAETTPANIPGTQSLPCQNNATKETPEIEIAPQGEALGKWLEVR